MYLIVHFSFRGALKLPSIAFGFRGSPSVDLRARSPSLLCLKDPGQKAKTLMPHHLSIAVTEALCVLGHPM